MNKPRILDPSFAYTPACKTTPDYLRAKFKRIQEELDAQKKAAPIPIRKEK